MSLSSAEKLERADEKDEEQKKERENEAEKREEKVKKDDEEKEGKEEAQEEEEEEASKEKEEDERDEEEEAEEEEAENDDDEEEANEEEEEEDERKEEEEEKEIEEAEEEEDENEGEEEDETNDEDEPVDYTYLHSAFRKNPQGSDPPFFPSLNAGEDVNMFATPPTKPVKRRREWEREKKKNRSNATSRLRLSSTDDYSSSKTKILKKTKKSAGPKNSKNDAELKQLEKGKEKLEFVEKPLFQRLWTVEDEITILKGLIDYSKMKHIREPALVTSIDMTGFYAYVNESFSTKVSRTQLADKVRRLKRKYQKSAKRNNFRRGVVGPQELVSMKLSKTVWGSQIASDEIKNQRVTLGSQKNEGKCSADCNSEEETFSRNLTEMVHNQTGLDKNILKRALKSLEGPPKEAMQEKWARFEAAELEYYYRRTKVVQDFLKHAITAKR